MIRFVAPADDPVAMRQAKQLAEDWNETVKTNPRRYGPMRAGVMRLLSNRKKGTAARRPAAKPTSGVNGDFTTTKRPDTKRPARETRLPKISGVIRPWGDIQDARSGRLQPGAFDQSIRQAQTGGRVVRLVDQHDPDAAIASTADGSLRLFRDGYGGLAFEADPRDTPAARRVVERIRSGRYVGVSPLAHLHKADGYPPKVYRADLLHIGIVPNPALDRTHVTLGPLEFETE